jgi:hypothetical protein
VRTTTGTYLGDLCKRNHNYNGTGMSLRYSSNWDCVACGLERNRGRAEQNRERVSQWSRDNPEKKQWWRRNNPDKVREIGRRWQQNNHTRTAQISQTRRARKRGNGVYRIENRDIRQLYERFGGLCAWCGGMMATELDHVQPIKRGGYHGLGNILPSCRTCNRSKGDREPWGWFRSQLFYSSQMEQYLRETLAYGEMIDQGRVE